MRTREALALGALHGPAELLPVSSSGHTELIPWLLGWSYAEAEPELRKAFEVALHAGTAVGMLAVLDDVHVDERRLLLIAGSFVPPAVVGLLFERPIERHLGGPLPIALGLLAGGAAMWWADAHGPRERGRDAAGLADALWLGAAQAVALVPGTSRSGMTFAVARLRGFGPQDAAALSRHVALPVIVGATALKGTRLLRRGLPERRAFAAGTLAAFASTLVAARRGRPNPPPPIPP